MPLTYVLDSCSVADKERETRIMDVDCEIELKMLKLYTFGLKTKEIADITGKTFGHVWRTLNSYKNSTHKTKLALAKFNKIYNQDN